MSRLEFITLTLVISLNVVTSLEIDPKLVAAITERCKLNFPNIQNYPTIEDTMEASYSTKDHDTKCFVHCFGQTSGIVTKNGKLVMSTLKMLKFADETTTTKAVNDCINIKASEKCETAYEQWRCFLKAAHIF